ncbi:helix-turn-helix domain-containing protein [Sphaerisporangium melleum]|uniref:helix-turn-helix domain-containing protein n=1 Tax=Sphaerisporangium melleum TaxID=321316 RepID=UPI001E5DE25E|nr:helix-turn-helix domain-containing protein [Sphaerisporangium melleum]
MGLNSVEELAYRLLIAAVEADRTELREHSGIGDERLAEALRSMEAKGLVREVTPGRYAAVAPDIALGAPLLRRQQALDWARRSLEELTEEYRANARRRDASQLVEVLPNRAAMRERLLHLQDNAREEVLGFCLAAPVAMTADENDAEPAALARGVAYRVIYERALLEEAGMQADVAQAIKLGERARAIPRLPVRLTIADREIALLTLVAHPGISEPTAALIRGGTLMEAMLALFESQWERAIPLSVMDGGLSLETAPCPLDPDDLYLLSLLVAGVPDKSIATQLGLSQRTVQRRVAGLMEAAGVQTRMQLAWHAAREGWLRPGV